MSDGFLSVNYFVSSFGMLCFCLKPYIVVLQEKIFIRRYVLGKELVQECGYGRVYSCSSTMFFLNSSIFCWQVDDCCQIVQQW